MSRIVYHTRNTQGGKIQGGTFGGTFDQETIERLVTSWFTVRELPSGSLCFVDQAGRDVSLYIQIPADGCKAGRILLEAQAKRRAEAEAAEEKLRVEAQNLVDELGPGEAIRRLRGNP
jgi:hypothetical protein